MPSEQPIEIHLEFIQTIALRDLLQKTISQPQVDIVESRKAEHRNATSALGGQIGIEKLLERISLASESSNSTEGQTERCCVRMRLNEATAICELLVYQMDLPLLAVGRSDRRNLAVPSMAEFLEYKFLYDAIHEAIRDYGKKGGGAVRKNPAFVIRPHKPNPPKDTKPRPARPPFSRWVAPHHRWDFWKKCWVVVSGHWAKIDVHRNEPRYSMPQARKHGPILLLEPEVIIRLYFAGIDN